MNFNPYQAKRICMSDVGLTEKDFNIRIYEDINELTPFPSTLLKINGIVCSRLSREMIQDMMSTTGLDIEKMLRKEAIDWYLNNPKIIRKLKLEKIKEKYEN